MSDLPEFELNPDFIQKVISEYLKKRQINAKVSRVSLNQKTYLEGIDIPVDDCYSLEWDAEE